MFLIPAGMSLFTGRTRQHSQMPWYLLGLLFILVIGFRDEVGCDWSNYIYHYQRTLNISLSDAFSSVKDPAHTFVNWQMGQWHWEVYGVNFIYAVIFVVCLIKFCWTQDYPWIACAVAVPYMVVMVSMGYSRQGVALGLFMLAITHLEQGKFKTYVAWVIVAALFHKSAIILLPFGLFLAKGGMLLRFAILIPVLYGGWDLLVAEQQEQLWKNYVEQQMQSSGARIRVFMNFVPAVLFLVYRKTWKKNYADYPFWFWVALGSLASMALVDEATTAVDRISLYFIPIQIAVFSRLPVLLRHQMSPQLIKVIIILGYTTVLFVWLFYASHAHCWIPYQNVLI